MRLPFRLRLTIVYTTLFLVFGVVVIVLTVAVVARMLDMSSLRAIPAALENRSLAEIRTLDLAEIVREARLAERERLRRAFVRVVLVVFLLLGLVGATAAWILAGRMLRPLRTITAHARSTTSSVLSERVGHQGPNDELKDLADTYDAMLARLDAAFRSQRSFSAHASHELRTPLAIAGAEADILLANPDATERERAFAIKVREVVRRNDALIDALLIFARAESRLVEKKRVDLSAIVGDAAGELEEAADEDGMRLDLSLERAWVRGDETLLARMVSNVILNGIRHNRRGGWTRVELSTTGQDAILIVENSGPLIDDAEPLFAPFQTGGTSHSGTGLGLAIVREVALAHSGTIRADARPEGGLRIVIELPQAQ